MKNLLIFILLTFSMSLTAQKVMTPELLWELGRLSVVGISDDKKSIVYKVSIPDIQENSFNSKTYQIPVEGGASVVIEKYEDIIKNSKLSPNGKMILYHEKVYLKDIKGYNKYENLGKSDVYIYDELDYRHWDTWSDGGYNHVFIKPANIPNPESYDIMQKEPYNTPLKPFGGPD